MLSLLILEFVCEVHLVCLASRDLFARVERGSGLDRLQLVSLVIELDRPLCRVVGSALLLLFFIFIIIIFFSRAVGRLLRGEKVGVRAGGECNSS